MRRGLLTVPAEARLITVIGFQQAVDTPTGRGATMKEESGLPGGG